jgi:hypothetical protein
MGNVTAGNETVGLIVCLLVFPPYVKLECGRSFIPGQQFLSLQ